MALDAMSYATKWHGLRVVMTASHYAGLAGANGLRRYSCGHHCQQIYIGMLASGTPGADILLKNIWMSKCIYIWGLKKTKGIPFRSNRGTEQAKNDKSTTSFRFISFGVWGKPLNIEVRESYYLSTSLSSYRWCHWLRACNFNRKLGKCIPNPCRLCISRSYRVGETCEMNS